MLRLVMMRFVFVVVFISLHHASKRFCLLSPILFFHFFPSQMEITAVRLWLYLCLMIKCLLIIKRKKKWFSSFHVFSQLAYNFMTMICMRSHFWRQTVVKKNFDMNVKINCVAFSSLDTHAHVRSTNVKQNEEKNKTNKNSSPILH